MKRARRRLIAIVSVMACGARMLWSPEAAIAQDEPVASTECCIQLLTAIGARSLGLGSAITATTSAGSLFVNPALLAELAEDQFIVHNAKTSVENSTTFTLLIRSNVIGSLGVSFRLVDLGEQDARDDNGVLTGTLARYAQVLTASYATSVTDGLNAGINYKLYQDRDECRGFCGGLETSATTHGIDVGVQYTPRALQTLEVGASAVHLGFPLQVVNAGQASPMPIRVRAGAAYEVLHHFANDSTMTLKLAVDAVVSPRNPDESIVNVGLELSLDETIFVWAGHAGGTGILGGTAIGVGLDYDRFELGIGRSLSSTPVVEEPVQISFGIRF